MQKKVNTKYKTEWIGFFAKTTIRALSRVKPERKYQILETSIIILFPALTQVALVHFFN